jgi:Zn-dependent protease with chaperone function
MGGRRSLETAALTSFIPVLVIVPFTLLALAVFWLPVYLITGLAYWWFPALWALAGLLLFVRPLQIAALSPLLGARRPTEDESRFIEPVWERLSNTNGFSPRHFVVRVLPADELNAFACGGHLVVVTSFAIGELDEDELAGVLAHELSHHLGFHTVALTISHWLSIPVVVLARIGFFLQNVARAATDSFASHSVVLSALGGIIAGILNLTAWAFLASLYAADAIANLFGHRLEFEADQRTVTMGYGSQLARALRRVISLDGSRRPEGWRERLNASHPPALTRVARIEAQLRDEPAGHIAPF